MKWLLTALLALCSGGSMAQEAPSVTQSEWTAYRERFVLPDGRVLDDGNDGISHSEGQGYGMLLAQLAGARDDFERIWAFTRSELLLRDDGLAAWRWQADATPHVTDVNSATDGDMLIAYALARAGENWNDNRLSQAATSLADAIGQHAVFEHDGRLLLKSGAVGFSAEEREDGPVVNLSYWIFEAFPFFEQLSPATDWARIASDGAGLIREARYSPRQLPPEWLSLSGEPRPADGFPAEFGYNAIRIPLYLARGGLGGETWVSDLVDAMRQDGGLALVDLETGQTTTTLTDPGYRIIPALVDCVTDGAALGADLATFTPTIYYPSTLHLLALSHIRTQHEDCLP